jgi:hypothetical protein
MDLFAQSFSWNMRDCLGLTVINMHLFLTDGTWAYLNSREAPVVTTESGMNRQQRMHLRYQLQVTPDDSRFLRYHSSRSLQFGLLTVRHQSFLSEERQWMLFMSPAAAFDRGRFPSTFLRGPVATGT